MAGPSDRERRRKVAETFSGLRDLRIELAVLNHRVGTRVRLRDLDFDCLDVIARSGPISPSALAGRLGVHLATMTGVLDRLEQGGWVTRGRAPGDRRAVVLASPPDRQREVYAEFDGMNTRMGQILARYSDDQLDAIVDFLRQTAAAGRASSDEIAGLQLAPVREGAARSAGANEFTAS
ncbi:MAG: MarR family transcriptional regulator [Streptosporangiaceae bacterium]